MTEKIVNTPEKKAINDSRNTIIKCENVSVNYSNFTACKDINFALPAGAYLAIVGENGSGKSTLLKAILGLLKLKTGNIRLERRNIGYLPQQNTVQKDFPASVWEVVLSGNVGRRVFFSKSEKLNALEKIERLHLESSRNFPFSTLSGGERQRVLLARSLVSGRRILALDEPCTGLDPLVTSELYLIMKEMNEQGTTILMISHDVHRAISQSTHILHMAKTQLFFGTVTEYTKTKLFTELEKVESCFGSK